MYLPTIMLARCHYFMPLLPLFLDDCIVLLYNKFLFYLNCFETTFARLSMHNGYDWGCRVCVELLGVWYAFVVVALVALEKTERAS